MDGIWGRGMGFGNLEEIFERGEDEASKDIAESPTAELKRSRNAQK